MADAPAGGAGAGAKLDPQAAIAKHAAITQAGAAGDAAIIARVENSIAHSPMGWLQSMLGEVDTRASSERGQVQGKISESHDLVAQNKKDAPKDAGPAPAPGVATHPAVPHPAAAGGKDAAHPAAAAGGGAAAAPKSVSVGAPKTSGGAAPAVAAAPEPTIAAAIASAGGDSQLDGILNAYTPKNQQPLAMVGRIKQMGDVAQGFNGQLDTYVAQGGAVEHGIASAANFLGVGKDTSAIWANNPYRKVHGILGGIMTGMSAVKNVCSVVGSVCGKLGLVLTVIGLLGMIFPPIGVAVSGIARVLNVVGIICDAISFVLSGILTGLNGVVLAQQISAGASAEEKAATADLMMSEANEAASGFVNMAMIFGPRFMKGLLGNSKGVVASLMKRAKATIGRVSLKLTADVKHFANKVVRKLGFGGAVMAREKGAWKDMGLIARTTDKVKSSALGKAFYGAPQHIEAIQEKLMAKYGNTKLAKGLDRVGAWGGSVAAKFDIEEKIGGWGESAGKKVGSLGENTKFGKSMAQAADRSERQTRELAMKMEARDAAHLEESRWKNYLDKRDQAPGHERDKVAEKKFIHQEGEKVRDEHVTNFEASEKKRGNADKIEQLRHDRLERHNEEFYENKTNGITGESARDEMMGATHSAREKRWGLEAQYATQEGERKELLGKASRSAEEETKLKSLNVELKSLDESRRVNKLYENELSGMAAGSERQRKPEYKNWADVGSNVWDSTQPILEMVGIKDQDSAWAVAEKASLKKQTKYSKSSAQAAAAGRGGHGTFEEIASDSRRNEMENFSQFVRSAPHASSVSGNVRNMLANVVKPQAPAAPATAAPTAAPATTTAPAHTPAAPAHTPAAAPAHTPAAQAHEPATTGPAQHHEQPHAPQHDVAAVAVHADAGPANTAAPAAPQQQDDADAGGAEMLPYWPALLPEFDKAQHDFGWMRKVAVEFKKAQIEGKQKAVDTLAVYGRYQEYAKLRQAAAAQNKTGAATTASNTQQNVDHAQQTQTQAGQGEGKQNEAKGAANDRSATDLPEPESRGFWGRILGAVKRWAKNKAAQVFGWIQEKIASVILKGLCGVSMGDMREYAGALRRQQAAAHGVADGAGKTSGHAEQAAIKLGSDATKESQGAADAIGECDRNIGDADTFMADVTSFEQQLTEEKAHAAAFIAQVHAASHAEQARQRQEQEQHAADERAQQQRSLALGGDTTQHEPHGAVPQATNAVAAVATQTANEQHPQPQQANQPDHHEEKHPAQDSHAEAATGEIHAASQYVASEAEQMLGRLDARAEDYHNQLAVALTNKSGKDYSGHDLKGPAKTESKHIVDEFKDYAHHTRKDMDAFTNMAIDPSSAKQIAETIIQTAEHLESNFQHSQHALDELFERTYTGIRDGKRTLTSRMFDGNNALGELNHAGDKASDAVIDTALPAANNTWNKVAAPIQVPQANEPQTNAPPSAPPPGAQAG